MSSAVADALVAEALDHLFVADGDLPPDVNERTVAGHLGRHLERALRPQLGSSGWSVDCDYNRLGLDKKRLPTLKEMLASIARGLGWAPKELIGKTTGLVAPDIVVHQRRSGRGHGNLIVCEVKRLGADKRDLAVDLAKLACYRTELGYQHAYLILLGETRAACVVHRAKTQASEIAHYLRQLDEAAAVRRWKQGQLLAAQRQRRLVADEGPRPARAVAESLSALNALTTMGMWPAPRDPISEQAVEHVRRRWAKVQHRAKQARSR